MPNSKSFSFLVFVISIVFLISGCSSISKHRRTMIVGTGVVVGALAGVYLDRRLTANDDGKSVPCNVDNDCKAENHSLLVFTLIGGSILGGLLGAVVDTATSNKNEGKEYQEQKTEQEEISSLMLRGLSTNN